MLLDDNITDSESFKFESGLTNNTDNAGTVNVSVSLKCVSNFWRTLEITLILTWSANCVVC